MDAETTVNSLKLKVKKFVDERGWDLLNAHSFKNICISIACEAAELMEIFNWQTDEEIIQTIPIKINEIENEVADIAFSLLDFCNVANIDLSDSIDEKFVLHAQKYPVNNKPHIRSYDSDESTIINHLKQKIQKFVDERVWDAKPGHNIKSLSISIACEAAELLEILNWQTDEEIFRIIETKKKEIKYEAADIAFALISFCNKANIDLSEAMTKKIIINAQKYPVGKSL